ncbi:DUF2789 family protein [Roseateles puraquae]|jgi:hypothetical protein|uniref:DUF2789 domain-containing protein n=1 Tax=Roseateles puraquae TaxID=431059 RepID=A0A254NMJ0_9BURK|nr:DUF2789 family protein [Roseateles puraquae]MDG0854607.1 DUF2789 domain-containing protein [Roseateles puraquae]OWR05998.1 hypothetical protein CDO81_06065 [Roseateles puraquae]
MQPGHHRLQELFEQLGLPSAPEAIDAFITRHRPTSLGCALPDAPVWTPAQASFLREAIAADADWALPAEWLGQALCQPLPEG